MKQERNLHLICLSLLVSIMKRRLSLIFFGLLILFSVAAQKSSEFLPEKPGKMDLLQQY